MGGALSLGKMLSPRLMIRGLLGYEFATFESIYVNAPVAGERKYSKKTSAFVPGAGVLYQISKHIIVGADYMFVAYKDVVPFSAVAGGVPNTNFASKIAFKEHRVLLRVAFKI